LQAYILAWILATTLSSPIQNCKDERQGCAAIRASNSCGGVFRTTMMQQCARTCGYCTIVALSEKEIGEFSTCKVEQQYILSLTVQNARIARIIINYIHNDGMEKGNVTFTNGAAVAIDVCNVPKPRMGQMPVQRPSVPVENCQDRDPLACFELFKPEDLNNPQLGMVLMNNQME
uniref:ShKT domain-containing protein n=1 Tax=Dracunculus medinensis TaxID=318479 RepID=A0A0N4US62_DRAME